ncbi:MAG TPA: MFS transporter [Acidimicrobiia bacterium]|nr:MFS transporter [Acidimicrobiia bacterium]
MRLLGALRPPDRIERRELGVLGLFAIVAFAQGWSGTVVTHALPFVQKDLGLSDAEVFDLMAAIRATSLLALGLSWWGDHRGRRRPLLLAFALLTSANLATALLPGAAAFTSTQALARIGTVAIGSLALVVLAEEVGPRIRGYALALYALFGSLGTGWGLIVRPMGAGGDDWRILFGLSAIPILALPFLMARVAESRAFVATPTRPPLAAVFRRGHAGRFWPMALLAFAISAFTSPAANLALVRLENALGWSAGGASLLLALTSAPGVAIGLLAGGRLADVAGRRPTQAVAIVIGVTGGIGFYFVETAPLLGLGIFLSTMGGSAFGPAFASHRSELFPTDLRATAGAWIVNASVLGGLTGFAAGRFVVDAWGIPVTIALIGGFLLVSASALLFLPETRGLSLLPDERTDPPEPPVSIPT